MWTVGLTLGGRYRLDALLGTDPVTGVWAATHLPSGRRVAVRCLPAVPDLGPGEVARLAAEVRAVSSLQHPSVAPTYDVVLGVAEAPVVVSAMLAGETLAELLTKSPMLSLQQTASLLLPVVSAVGTAHARGIVHGKLSTSSIFIVERGEVPLVQVLDFGVAQWTAALRPAPSSVRGSGAPVRRGSEYEPPEEIVPGRHIDHRADIWALGIILYECLSGQRPADFVPTDQAFLDATAALVPVERHVAGLPRALSDAIADLVVIDPEHRAQNLIELFNVLGPLAGEPSPSFGWPGSERRISGLTQGIPLLPRPESKPPPAAAARTPSRLPGWRGVALGVSAVAAAELVLLISLVTRMRRNEARWEQRAGAAAAPVERSRVAGEPQSESLMLRAAPPPPPPVTIDDFDGQADAPTAAAFGPWQAFTLNPPGRALPLVRGPGNQSPHGLEIHFLMDDDSAGQRSGAGAASSVRGGVVDMSHHAWLAFSHRFEPLESSGVRCQGPARFVGFVTCRPGSDTAPRQLELGVSVSTEWTGSSLSLAGLRSPSGAEPSADGRAACLSAVDALGFRLDEADAEPGGCQGGTLFIDDVGLR